MAKSKPSKIVFPFDTVEVDGERDIGPSVIDVFGTEAQRQQARQHGVIPGENPDTGSGEQTPTS